MSIFLKVLLGIFYGLVGISLLVVFIMAIDWGLPIEALIPMLVLSLVPGVGLVYLSYKSFKIVK